MASHATKKKGLVFRFRINMTERERAHVQREVRRAGVQVRHSLPC